MTEAEKWRKAVGRLKSFLEDMVLTYANHPDSQHGFDCTLEWLNDELLDEGLSLDPPSEKECEHNWVVLGLELGNIQKNVIQCQRCGEEKE